MKPLYLASLYYDNQIVSGANKRFDAIGKRLVARLGGACKSIVPAGQKPTWIDERNCLTVPAFSSNLGKLKTFVHFANTLRNLPAGVVINDFIPIPFFALKRHTHFQLIHDFRDFTDYKRDQVPLLAKRILKWQLQRSEKVITVSDFSKKDAIEFCGLREQDVIRSYNGIDDTYSASHDHLMRDVDLLYVATFEDRKNHTILMRALESINLPLQITFVGRDHGLRPAIQEQAALVSKQNGMVFDFIDRIDEEQLVRLYQRTKTYVCPSVLEGFGMPLVEALAANCRVVCSDIPVFHEVCHEHALYFDPQEALDMGKAIQESLKMTASTTAERYAKKFSWETITDELLRDINYES